MSLAGVSQLNHAGYIGAALLVKACAWQLNQTSCRLLPGMERYANQNLLFNHVRSRISEGEADAGRKSGVLVIGNLGPLVAVPWTSTFRPAYKKTVS